jgi:hypothetical protein
MAENQRNRTKSFWYIIICLNVIVPIVVMEIGVRYIYIYWKPLYTPESLREQYLQYEGSIFSQHVIAQREAVIPGWGVKYEINEMGYRGASFSAMKPVGKTRIVFLGGSSVFDSQAARGQDWPHLVEKRLHASGFPDIECINAGTPGHTTFDAVGRLYSEIHTFDPDYVVLSCEWNDIKYFTSNLTLLRDYKPLGVDYRFNYFNEFDKVLCEVSQLYVKLRNRYILAGINVGYEGQIVEGEVYSEFNPEKLEQYRLNLQLFVDCARNIGAIPILMTEVRLPNRRNTEQEKQKIKLSWTYLTHEGICLAFDACDMTIKDVASEKDVTLIDASSNLSGQSELMVDHVHLLSQGSNLLAGLVADRIMEILPPQD